MESITFLNLSVCQHGAKKRDRFWTRDTQFPECPIWPIDIPVRQEKREKGWYHRDRTDALTLLTLTQAVV